MQIKSTFELEDNRDLTAFNATVLDVRDGDVFVSAVMDRDGNRRLALFAGVGVAPVAILDSADVVKLLHGIAMACQGHGAQPQAWGFRW